MPNKNYISGRAYEYKTKWKWEDDGYIVVRSAGSHGVFDLVAIPPATDANRKVVGIQCKRQKTTAGAKRLIENFKANPPLGRSHPHVIQWMTVWTPDGEQWGWI